MVLAFSHVHLLSRLLVEDPLAILALLYASFQSIQKDVTLLSPTPRNVNLLFQL
jgi:hypothetical protein